VAVRLTLNRHLRPRFSDVREAPFANPYQRTWGADGEPPLPVHPVTLSSLLYGVLPGGPPYVLIVTQLARLIPRPAQRHCGAH
jgi:hypothetical protein